MNNIVHCRDNGFHEYSIFGVKFIKWLNKRFDQTTYEFIYTTNKHGIHPHDKWVTGVKFIRGEDAIICKLSEYGFINECDL
jgi:hypothetical protein